MSSQSEVIETTVSKVAAELVRRGLDPDDRGWPMRLASKRNRCSDEDRHQYQCLRQRGP